MEMPIHLKIAREAAQRLNLRTEFITGYRDGLLEVSSPHTSVVVKDQQHLANRYTAAYFANDKAYARLLLQRANQRVPVGREFLLQEKDPLAPKAAEEAKPVIQYAEAEGYPRFVKPIDGSFGKYARAVHDSAQLLDLIHKIRVEYRGILIEEIVHGNEHRLFIQNGEPVFSYHKSLPTITADGQHSLAELVQRAGLELEKYRAFFEETYGSIEHRPAFGQAVQLSHNANVSNGGVILDFRTRFSPEIRSWAAELSQTTGLAVFAVDFFSPSDLDAGTANYCILEINSNAYLSSIYKQGHRDVAIGVWQTQLAEHFGIDHRIPNCA